MKFKELDNKKINILCSGCSFTFGEGLPEEAIWPTILSKKIKFLYNQDVDVYNLGYPGHSIDSIIKNVLSFIKLYGKPNYLFICFPSISRYITFEKENLNFPYKVFHPNLINMKNKISKFAEKELKNYKEENNIFNHFLLIHLIEEYCLSNDIKLMWTTWETEESFMYEQIDFNNYILAEVDYKKTFVNKNIENLPYWKIAEDGGHPGSSWNFYLSNIFEKEIKNEII